MLKLIIAGSRIISDMQILIDAMNKYKFGSSNVSEIVEGGAKGVDLMARGYARMFGIICSTFKADWDKFGKSAGPIRNAQMAEYGDKLLAIWDGKSKGTANMISEMKRRGKPVIVVEV